MKNPIPTITAINSHYEDEIYYAPEGAHTPYFPFFLKELSETWDENDGYVDDTLYVHVTSLTHNMIPCVYENDAIMKPIAETIYSIAQEEDELLLFLNRASTLLKGVNLENHPAP